VTSRERTNVHQVFHLPGEERSKEIKEEEKEKKSITKEEIDPCL
jgi:hypothetical protein